ncbi:MAG: M48 family metalloprotease [Candidatus Tectomicrobia bacterium]|uniref:M48 family metalloprotease n=1 Tax=Tectimicrobiota bacterium TaxID=2528274 RepID=A0A932FVN8_UNCTE|nr:M48 family metalloprotease [Candidatus Tectomicrobia bacterium]
MELGSSGKSRPTLIAFVLGIALLASSCASSGINKGQFNMISLSEEVEAGRMYSQRIEKELKVLRLQVLEEYVELLGQRIARNSDQTDIIYHFKVIENDQVNAFTLPGGFIYVHTGLIEACKTEAQLASVLAHEIGHVAARHWAETVSLQTGLETISSIVVQILGVPRVWQQQALQLAIGLGFMAYSRSQEAEADRLGARYLANTGYNPRGMVEMFEILQAQHDKEPSRFSAIFASHPLTSDRIVQARREIQHLPPPEGPDKPIVNTPQFSIIKSYFVKD